jgi:hypothetical protein
VKESSRFRVVDVLDQGDSLDVHMVVTIPFGAMGGIIEVAEKVARLARVARHREPRRGLARVFRLPVSERADTDDS